MIFRYVILVILASAIAAYVWIVEVGGKNFDELTYELTLEYLESELTYRSYKNGPEKYYNGYDSYLFEEVERCKFSYSHYDLTFSKDQDGDVVTTKQIMEVIQNVFLLSNIDPSEISRHFFRSMTLHTINDRDEIMKSYDYETDESVNGGDFYFDGDFDHEYNVSTAVIFVPHWNRGSVINAMRHLTNLCGGTAITF